jgi:hypothetical protein
VYSNGVQKTFHPHVRTHHFDNSELWLLFIREGNFLVPAELLALPGKSCALNLATCTLELTIRIWDLAICALDLASA